MRSVLTGSIATLILFAAGCSEPGKFREEPRASAEYAAELAVRKVNLEAAKAQAEVQTEMQKRLLTIQMEVVKSCVAKGGYPVVVGNGNIDCKKQ